MTKISDEGSSDEFSALKVGYELDDTLGVRINLEWEVIKEYETST